MPPTFPGLEARKRRQIWAVGVSSWALRSGVAVAVVTLSSSVLGLLMLGLSVLNSGVEKGVTDVNDGVHQGKNEGNKDHARLNNWVIAG